ncbi:MAG TPA: HlyD family secretion protein [Longimicrobium sp.]|nr:HlyD family secretion protein [Longimicrobium sp.]
MANATAKTLPAHDGTQRVSLSASTPDAPEAVVEAPKKKKPVLPILGVLLLALLAFFGWRWWNGRNWETTDNAQVEGHVTPVLPRVGGYVADVRVAENQNVKKGDTLAVIDDRDLRTRLAAAEADLAAAEEQVTGGSGQAVAQAAAAQAQAGAARAQIAAAVANANKAHRDVERLRPLAERNIVSKQQYDAVVAAAAAADAQVAAARETANAAGSQATAAGAGVRVTRSRIESARAARDAAALQLSYTVITAPMDGVVAKKSVEVGQMVQPGQPIMSVVPLNDVWVTANLKETQTRDLKPGDPVEVEVDAYPGRTFPGKLESISPATGARFSLLPPDNATGNYTKVVQRIPVRIRFDGREDPQHPLRPGMSATVRIKARG